MARISRLPTFATMNQTIRPISTTSAILTSRAMSGAVLVRPSGEAERPRRTAGLEPRVHTVFRHPRRHYRFSRTAPAIVRSRLAIWAPLPLTRYAVMIPVHLYVRTVREKVFRLGARSHLRAVNASIAVEWGLMRFGRVGV